MAMAMTEQAHDSMTALALKFELETGNRIRWRNAPGGVVAILNMSLHSGQSELVKLAEQVLSSLTDGWLMELANRGLNFPGMSSNPALYRGASSAVLESGAREGDVFRAVSKANIRYRGARLFDDSQEQAADASASESKSAMRYRGQLIYK